MAGNRTEIYSDRAAACSDASDVCSERADVYSDEEVITGDEYRNPKRWRWNLRSCTSSGAGIRLLESGMLLEISAPATAKLGSFVDPCSGVYEVCSIDL